MFMSNFLNAIESAQDNDLARCIPETATVMRPVVEALQQVTTVDNLLKQDCLGQLSVFLPLFVKKLEQLPVSGPGMAFSGGWADHDGGHAILIIVFKDTPETYSVVTCNTGEGAEYHPSIPTEIGKKKSRAAICCSGILRDRILDFQFWAVFFNVRNTPSDINRPEAWYDVMLPHLCGCNLFVSSSESVLSIQKQLESESDDTQGDFETVQRSGTCFYRCILSGCRHAAAPSFHITNRNIQSRYLMKRCGLKKPQQKLLFVHMRWSMLKTARQHWLQLHPSSAAEDFVSLSSDSEPVEKSDIFILTIACNQTARAAGKLMASSRTEPLSTQGHESIAKFCDEFRSLLKVRPRTSAKVAFLLFFHVALQNNSSFCFRTLRSIPCNLNISSKAALTQSPAIKRHTSSPICLILRTTKCPKHTKFQCCPRKALWTFTLIYAMRRVPTYGRTKNTCSFSAGAAASVTACLKKQSAQA